MTVTLWRILPESGTTGQDSDDLPVPYHTGDESCLSAPIQCPPILDPLDDDWMKSRHMLLNHYPTRGHSTGNRNVNAHIKGLSYLQDHEEKS